jgi:cytochrome c556
MFRHKLLWIGISVCSSLLLSSAAFSQEEAIEKRIKIMKSNSADNKAIKAAVAQNDHATIEAKAKDIMGNLDSFVELFPKGSTAENSRAKPEIWDKWDDFKKEAGMVKAAAKDLADAAAAKNDAQVGEKFTAFGKACGTCHKTFRAEKKK